jgi:glycosyltransferase involved in cell wall biosynthesis
MRTPGVSVVVPGHNASGTLRSSLQALRSQDWPKELLEIVYVDDASTDDSIDAAIGLADRIVRLTGSRKGPGRPAAKSWYSSMPMFLLRPERFALLSNC